MGNTLSLYYSLFVMLLDIWVKGMQQQPVLIAVISHNKMNAKFFGKFLKWTQGVALARLEAGRWWLRLLIIPYGDFLSSFSVFCGPCGSSYGLVVLFLLSDFLSRASWIYPQNSCIGLYKRSYCRTSAEEDNVQESNHLMGTRVGEHLGFWWNRQASRVIESLVQLSVAEQPYLGFVWC